VVIFYFLVIGDWLVLQACDWLFGEAAGVCDWLFGEACDWLSDEAASV